jgi:hypothetical protein
MTSRRWPAVLFWVLVATAAMAHVTAIWSSLTRAALWEDEAFNLTVPLNLLAGLGYSSDGTLSGSTITPFDPRISTGPVVLLPIAAVLAAGGDLVIGSRLVPAAFFVALLVALWLLGRRIGGRWAALAAISVPLAFDAGAPPSPIQGPTDVLGEIPAAALLAWAAVVLRRRPWLSGLLLGLAIQAKYISFLAVPAFVVAVLVVGHGLGWGRRLRALILPAVMAVVPTVLVEVAAFVALGPAGFRRHLGETVAFLRGGGQPGVHSMMPEKLWTLASSWQLPAGIVIAAFVLLLAAGATALVLAVLAVRGSGRRWRAAQSDAGAPGQQDRLQLLVVAVLGAGAFVGWWAVAVHTPLWVRHPAPGLYAFMPVLAAFVVLVARVLWQRGEHWRVASVATAAVLTATVAGQLGLAVGDALNRPDTLSGQRAVAAEVSDAGADWIATVWGGSVSIVVLAGSHVALSDAPPENIAGYPLLLPGSSDACGGVPLATAPGYVLCAETSPVQ